jgi:hypothetical protein
MKRFNDVMMKRCNDEAMKRLKDDYDSKTLPLRVATHGKVVGAYREANPIV